MELRTNKNGAFKIGRYVFFLLILQSPVFASVGRSLHNEFFVNEPRNVTAFEGATVYLPCLLNVTNGIAKWKHEENFLDINPENSRIRTINNALGDFTLKIANLSMQDTGKYDCKAFIDNTESVESITIKLYVLDVSSIKPELGEGFIRFLSVANIRLTCETDTDSGAVQGLLKNNLDFAQKAPENSSLDTVSSKTDLLNTLFKVNSDTVFSCEISNPNNDECPRISLIIKILYPSKLILRLKMGSAESDNLECLSSTKKKDKIIFSCYRIHGDLQPVATMNLSCAVLANKDGGDEIVCRLRSATKEDLTYYFKIITKQSFGDMDYCNENFGIFVFKPNAQPGFLVWEKLDCPTSVKSNGALVINEDNSSDTNNINENGNDLANNCTNESSKIIVQMEVDNLVHRITLNVPISLSAESAGQMKSCGFFQTTCYLWFWHDKVFNIVHDGIVLANLCKVVTLNVNVTVHDINSVDLSKNLCLKMNDPQSNDNFIQQFFKIPSLYPVLILLSLLCITLTMMIYIGRKLFFVLTSAKDEVKGEVATEPHVKRSSKQVYIRFLNNDEIHAKNKTMV